MLMKDSMRTIRSLVFVCLLISALASTARAADSEFSDQDLQFFETKVRPVLVEHCYRCHSTEAKKLKAGLFMDSRDAILKGGDTGPAMVVGDADKSLFIEAIKYDNVDLQMPPKEKLSDEVIADLTRWVKMGAPWPKEKKAVGQVEAFDLSKRKSEHWSWKPVQPQTLPAVKDKAWARNPIDLFILAKLEANGLTPAKDADPRTLVRRIYFDVIGLPPTPEQTVAFVKAFASNSQAAIESLVDELLASPHFGEKWARHWLDLTRFAETCGHEFDYPLPHAWRYRDYVIRALNAGLPYNDFLVEHIAGDLLENPRRNPEEGFNESIVATGFWHLHEAVHAPVDVRLDEAIRVDNQIDVMMRGFFGLTVACARCHDHKFDAISTKDYYALAGFLQSSRRQVAMLDPKQQIAAGVSELRKAIDQANRVFSDAKVSTKADEWSVLFQAAYTVMFDPPKVNASAPQPDAKDIIIEDFETGDYRNWTVNGDAFGDKPQTLDTIADYQGRINAVGKYFVNSHQKRGKGRGDDHTGDMTSKPFTIERDYITMLVGGGNHKDKTCVNLVVDGKTVISTTGPANNQMIPVTWDVRAWRGKQATIQIIDHQTGGWGNIGVDQIVMTNTADGNAVAKNDMPSDAVIQAVAKRYNVDAGLLSRWIAALKHEDLADRDHPMHGWRAAKGDPKEVHERVSAIVKQVEEQRGRADAYEGTRLGDFDGKDFDGWFVTGQAFGDQPTQPGQWDSVARDGTMIEPGVAHSGAISRRLQGVLRSPTFEITSPRIHYRVKGKGQIRLIIDGYVMDVYNGLLFRDISFNVDTKGQWQWRSQGGDLGKYVGHRAYIEVVDDDDDWIAIDAVTMSDGGPPGETAGALPSSYNPETVRSPKALADAMGSIIAEAAGRWRAGKATAADQALIVWLAQHELGFFGQDQAAVAAKIAEAKKTIEEIERRIPHPMKVQALTDGTGEN